MGYVYAIDSRSLRSLRKFCGGSESGMPAIVFLETCERLLLLQVLGVCVWLDAPTNPNSIGGITLITPSSRDRLRLYPTPLSDNPAISATPRVIDFAASQSY